MQLADLTSPAVAALPADTPVVIPLAALEQHGAHLPLFTDSLLCGEIARRAEQRLGDRALFAPLVWWGNSDHHLDFAGTLSAPPRVYLDLLGGLLDNCLRHGWRRVVLLNGHGGNHLPGQQAVFEARQRCRERDDVLLLLATYWLLGSSPAAADPNLRQTRMGHACEWETSMVLRLRPELVGEFEQLDDVAFPQPFAPAERGWITREITPAGYLGQPRHATAEKGERLLQTFTDDVVNLLERVAAWRGPGDDAQLA